MRTDLGTWRAPQAAAVVRALERAGLSPKTERAGQGTRITVPEAQNDEAHRVLAGAMDDIARAAAEAEREPRRRRRKASEPGGGSDHDEPTLVSERLRNAAPIAGLVVALMIAAMIPAGALRTSVFVAALVAFGVVWAARNEPDDRDGPR